MRPLKRILSNPLSIIAILLRRIGKKIIPDKLYLSIIYFCEMKSKINWKNPQTFTEKIQWLKIYDRNPLYTTLVDKDAVKEFVAKKIGEEYIIPKIGVWDNFNQIDFKTLPKQFVLKTTFGGGGDVIIVRDKTQLNVNFLRNKFKKFFKDDIASLCKEWPYKNVPRKIIAENLLEGHTSKDLIDYKWFCFNGEPYFCQVIRDRNSKETIDFFDKEWNHQDFIGLNPNCKNGKELIPKPKNLDQHLKIARKLSENIPFVRVDLYDVDDKIYFGELTFYPASGIGQFSPKKWNKILGDLLVLPKI